MGIENSKEILFENKKKREIEKGKKKKRVGNKMDLYYLEIRFFVKYVFLILILI